MILYWKRYLAEIPFNCLTTQAETSFRIVMSLLINSKPIFIFFGQSVK